MLFSRELRNEAQRLLLPAVSVISGAGYQTDQGLIQDLQLVGHANYYQEEECSFLVAIIGVSLTLSRTFFSQATLSIINGV